LTHMNGIFPLKLCGQYKAIMAFYAEK